MRHMDNVRLKTVDLQGKETVKTLKTDLVYYPSGELSWDASTGLWHLHQPTVHRDAADATPTTPLA